MALDSDDEATLSGLKIVAPPDAAARPGDADTSTDTGGEDDDEGATGGSDDNSDNSDSPADDVGESPGPVDSPAPNAGRGTDF